MSDDILIRVGDGVTREWVLSPSNTSLTAVQVDGVAVAYTRPTWNKVRLTAIPAAGAQVSFVFMGSSSAENAPPPVDLTPVLQAIEALQSSAGASAAVSGEVKLFALANEQKPPTGWQLDTAREVTATDLPIVALAPTYASVSSTAGYGLVQIGEDTYTIIGSSVSRHRVFSATLEATTAHPTTFPQGGMPAMCSLGGKLCILGGGTTPRTAVYEIGRDGVFVALNNLPAALTHASAVELPGNRVLVAGGMLTGGTTFNTALLVFTRGVGWSTLSQNLDEGVTFPHLVTLPSGKIGIFSGAVSHTATRSTKYYIFDPLTLSLSPARTIPPEHVPYSAYDACTLRTQNGGAYVTKLTTADNTHFSEYNEATDSFAVFQMRLPGGYLNPQSGATSHYIGQDQVPSPYGHVFIPNTANVRPFVALRSGLVPSYRFLRKQ